MCALEKFREMGLSEQILEALEKKGFEEPSAIQAATIPLLLRGEKDVIGQAQTGTGKTAAFGIPIIEKLSGHKGHVQALILTPTRELGIQVAEELNSLKGGKRLEVAPVYGGQDIETQIGRLRRGVDIVVATPGRCMDLMRRGKLPLDKIEFAVLDEADEMLNMGFVEDIETILASTPPGRKMLMFSATMPPPIIEIAKKFMGEYELVRLESKTLATPLAEQIYFEVRMVDKFEALTRIIDIERDFHGLVFCRTRNDVDDLVGRLLNRGHAAEALHGDISQAQRTKVVEKIKRGRAHILVATDVAARGLDINNLTHVINYSLPQDPEAYIHRIGRTGRAGRKGTAVTFVTPAEYRKLTSLKRVAGDIKKMRIPNASDVVDSKVESLRSDLSDIIATEKHLDYLGLAVSLLSESEPEVAVAALLRRAFEDELLPEKYADIGQRAEKASVDTEGTARLLIALGKRNGYNPKRIVDMLWNRAKVKSRKIDAVKCFESHSFITVPFQDAERILAAFHNKDGQRPFVEIAGDGSEGGGEGSDEGGRPRSCPRKDFKRKRGGRGN